MNRMALVIRLIRCLVWQPRETDADPAVARQKEEE